MRARMIALADQVRGFPSPNEANRGLMPILTLRYAYQHQERLAIPFRYTWDELTHDHTNEKISWALHELGDRFPQIKEGLAQFQKADRKHAWSELVYLAGKIDFPENGKELLEAYFEAGAKAKGRSGLLFE